MMGTSILSSPQSGSTSSSVLPEGYSTGLPSSTPEPKETANVFYEQLKEQASQIDKLNKKLNTTNSSVRKFEKEMHDISNRNIEVIGIFSSIVAFLIISANIITRTENLTEALVLVVAFTCSISVFCSLIHHFFGTGDNSLGKAFYIPISVIALLLITCLLCEKCAERTPSSIQESTITTPQNKPQHNTTPQMPVFRQGGDVKK